MPLALLSLLAVVLIYDWLTLGKIHKTSLLAAVFAVAMNVLGSVVAGSELGLEFVRRLA